MQTKQYIMHRASVHGVMHDRWNINNQDAALTNTLEWQGRTYRIGLVADGCTDLPNFSHTEVGANLSVVFCLGRIQELIRDGVPTRHIPGILYLLLVDYLSTIANLTMPQDGYWPYSLTFKGHRAFRNDISPTGRFAV